MRLIITASLLFLFDFSSFHFLIFWHRRLGDEDNKTKIDLIVFCVYHPNDVEKSKIKMIYIENMKKIFDVKKRKFEAKLPKVRNAVANSSPPVPVIKLRDDYIKKDKLYSEEEDRYCASGLLLYRFNEAENEIEILIGRDRDKSKLSLLVSILKPI